MSAAAHALNKLAEACSEYDARLVRRDVIRLEKLGLFLRIRQANVSSPGGVALFIGQFDASTSDRPGIGVTCVGFSSTPPEAATDAAAQWGLGVLPVLAEARGAHACLAVRESFTVPAEAGPLEFAVVRGPVLERGEHDGGEAAAPPPGGYLPLLAEALRSARLGDRLHWLECFAVRMADGSLDATCRLDNRDWAPGQQLLLADARGWPGATPSMHSRRQFLLMLPRGSWPAEPEPRSFWSRLFGGNAG